MLVVVRPCTLLHGRLQRSLPSPLAVGGALVLALSASDAVVVPALMAALVMSAAEAAGDSTTSVSGIILQNASWPEAFLLLSNVIGELCTCEKTWINNNSRAGTRSKAVSGSVRTMCGSRTGGWSLPGVMSD
jgi:hypothetical protein